MRLGMNICDPHLYSCGAQVDACGTHSLVCKQAPGREARHHVLNDVVARAFISVSNEPTGLEPCRLEMPRWHDTDSMAGRQASSLECNCHLHICQLICRSTGTRKIAATCKEAKYSNLPSQYTFHPISIKTQGPLNMRLHSTICAGDCKGFFLISTAFRLCAAI